MTPFVDFCPWPAQVKIVYSTEPHEVCLAGIRFCYDEDGTIEPTPTTYHYSIELDRYEYEVEDGVIECYYGWVIYGNEIYVVVTEPEYLDYR